MPHKSSVVSGLPHRDLVGIGHDRSQSLDRIQGLLPDALWINVKYRDVQYRTDHVSGWYRSFLFSRSGLSNR